MSRFSAIFAFSFLFTISVNAQQQPSLDKLKSASAVKHDESSSLIINKPVIQNANINVEQTQFGSKNTARLITSF